MRRPTLSSDGRIYDSVIVEQAMYMEAVAESMALAKTGVMRLVCLPSQAEDARRWAACRTIDDALATVFVTQVLHD